MRRLLDKNGRRILTRLLIIISSALFITFFIEWRFFGNDSARTWEFIFNKPLVFFWNALLLAFFELIISSPFKTPWTGTGITFMLSIIIMYITVQKQSFRGQPLMPEDFSLTDQAGTITKFIDIGSLVRMIIAVLIALGLTILLNYLTKTFFDVKDRTEPKRFWNKNLRIFRFTIAIVGFVGFASCSGFAINRNGERYQEIPFLDSKFIAWNQMLNYEQNGFIIGFLYNISKLELKAPDGYSEEKMAEIKAIYNPEPSEDGPEEKQGKTLADVDYNIVIVLDESFYDLSVISDYVKITPGEVTPNLRKLINNDAESKNYAVGQMYSVDYGGGTANVEFEVDTSMTNFWIGTVPYVDLVPHVETVPSIAHVAKEAGYKTLAIHPFNGGMYKRNTALVKEGFDRFIDESEMEFKEKDENREYINDRSAYRETMKYLKENDEKTLISLITMQNHAGYGKDGFDNLKYSVSADVSNDDKSAIAVYAQSLNYSDQHLGEFLSELENFDEKTVVLWYGDHSPGIFEKINNNVDKNVRDLSYVTPYFVWANFELEEKEYDNIIRFRQKKTTLPTTSPNCLTNTMFDLLGLEKPDYMKLSSEVCKETPILSQPYYENEGPFKSTTLSNYELFTYDILGGKRYWLK